MNASIVSMWTSKLVSPTTTDPTWLRVSTVMTTQFQDEGLNRLPELSENWQPLFAVMSFFMNQKEGTPEGGVQIWLAFLKINK